MAQQSLETARLRLIPLSVAELRLCLVDQEALEAELGLPISRAIMTIPLRQAIIQKLTESEPLAESTDWLWLTYWLITIRRPPFGAGMAGFKGMPDQQGNVEIGYGIDPHLRRQGYMTEAVRVLIDWAFCSPHCQSVSADTLQGNRGSQRVLEKIGMRCYRETAEMRFYRLEKEQPDQTRQQDERNGGCKLGK